MGAEPNRPHAYLKYFLNFFNVWERLTAPTEPPLRELNFFLYRVEETGPTWINFFFFKIFNRVGAVRLPPRRETKQKNIFPRNATSDGLNRWNAFSGGAVFNFPPGRVRS